MDLETKKMAFEYLLNQMLKWGAEFVPQVSYSSFTRLKALKLLFFTAAIRDGKGRDLLDVFDNFYALPNGPVESDIYNLITADQLMYYTFRDFSFNRKMAFSVDGLDEDLQKRIDSAVEALRLQNKNIVTYRAEQLVRLSHYWLSWQNSIQIAQALGKGSYKMDVNTIRTNPQYFAL